MDWLESELNFELWSDEITEASMRHTVTDFSLGNEEHKFLPFVTIDGTSTFQFGSRPCSVELSVSMGLTPEYMEQFWTACHFVRAYYAVGGFYTVSQTRTDEEPFRRVELVLNAYRHYGCLISERDRMFKQIESARGNDPNKYEPFLLSAQNRVREAYARSYPRRGWVYVIPEPVKGTYKIGKAADPDDRIGTFEVKLPFDVTVDHLIRCTDRTALESALHRHFAAERVKGEWFALSEAQLQALRSLTYVDDVSCAIDQLALLLGARV